MISLKGKTKKEKIKLKSVELAKVKIGKFTKDNFDIEIIGDIKKINGGIQLFAKARKNGKQLGFGKDGSVEIERFRFFNPPVLVDDINGDIVREWEEEDLDTKIKTLRQRKLKYDPIEAIKQSLAHTILQVGKNGNNIISGKVGNTTSTFYSGAGDGHVRRQWVSWSSAYDGSATEVDYDSAWSRITVEENGGNYGIARSFYPIDTSSIPDGDTISSAKFSIYENDVVRAFDPDVIYYLVEGKQASTSSLTANDQNISAIGSISFGTHSFSSSGVGFRDFVLNSSGISNISKTGYSKFAVRREEDFDDDPGSLSGFTTPKAFYTSDEAGTTKDPKLVVEHSEVATGAFFQFF